MRALWHLSGHGEVGQEYNIVDKANSSEMFVCVCVFVSSSTPAAQGSISALVSKLFEIEHDYFGTMMSNLAKVCDSETNQDKRLSLALHVGSY